MIASLVDSWSVVLYLLYSGSYSLLSVEKLSSGGKKDPCISKDASRLSSPSGKLSKSSSSVGNCNFLFISFQ